MAGRFVVRWSPCERPAVPATVFRTAEGRAGITLDTVFVSDLRHFLDMPEDVPGPARRMAEHLTLLVRAATAGDAGQAWVTALPCRRRPGRRPCMGHLAVFRSDVPPSIEWRCDACGDDGVISGWERSPFDLRPRRPEPLSAPTLGVVVPPDVAATLRDLRLVDTAGERLVFRARHTEEGIVLAGDADDLDELLGYVAAEVNHEPDRRRQKRLDQAFEVLNALVDRPR
ncbi:MAG: hypothetical protein ACR2HM_04035 [Acidimicrobiales bacterium]